ncbi:MAG: hypothetical protein ACKVT1_10025 [Dehalococcoidia bacterium]
MAGTVPDADAAKRLVHAISLEHGVTGVVACDPQLGAIGAATRVDAAREAALCTLIQARLAALTAPGGDLRGMGRMLVGAELEQITMAGPEGDFVLLPYGEGGLVVSLDHGLSPEAAVQSLQTIMRRYQ